MKTPKKVDTTLLRRILKEIEADGPLKNQSMLYQKTAEQYNNALRDIKMGANANGILVESIFDSITSSVVMLRIKENNIRVKTLPGKRGRPRGTIKLKDGQPIKRTTRAEKFQNNPKIVESLEAIRKEFPQKQGWVDKLEGGSVIYGVRLKCYECGGGQVSEIKNCPILACPLYPFLPRNASIENIEDNE